MTSTTMADQAESLTETLNSFVLRQENASLMELDQQLVSSSALLRSNSKDGKHRFNVKSESKSLRNLTNVLITANETGYLTLLDQGDLVPFLDTVCNLVEFATQKCMVKSNSEADEECEQTSETKQWKFLEYGTEACLLVLTLLTSNDIPTVVVQEQSIELVLNFLKSHLDSMVFPFMDIATVQKAKHRERKKKKKKSIDENDVAEPTGDNRHDNKLLKLIREVVGTMTTALSRFAVLVSQRGIDDTVLLQLSTMCLKTFEIEPNLPGVKTSTFWCPLQQSAIEVIREIFSHCEWHRGLLLDDILSMMRQHPTATRHSTKLQVFHDQREIRMSNALVLYVLQSCAGLPPVEQNELENEESLPSNCNAAQIATPTILERKHSARGVENLYGSCHYFIDSLCKRCINQEHESHKEYCTVLGGLVDDLLSVLHLPEWPVAEILLQMVCKLVSRCFTPGPKSKSVNATFGNLGLSVLGRIIAAVAKDVAVVRELPLVIPHPSNDLTTTTSTKEMRNPMEHGEDIACPCGRGYVETETLIDCDYCHRWYHAGCVRVGDVAFLQYFQCNDCKVLQHVNEQLSRRQGGSLASEQDHNGLDNSQQGRHPNDTEIFRQLYLNYLAQQRKRDPNGIRFVMEVCLSQWYSIDSRAGAKPSHLRTLRTQWEECKALSKDKKRDSDRSSLSTLGTCSVIRQLAASRNGGLCSESTCITLLARLLQVLGTGQPSFRARAIRALAAVIESDPQLMTNEKVKRAVEQRVLDDSISVREATLELVSRFVRTREDLAEEYCGILLERLTDKGLSVRKRVVRVFRELLIDLPELSYRTAICKGLVDRMTDAEEEDVVKEAIQSTLQELWFSDDPTRIARETTEVALPVQDELPIENSQHDVASLEGTPARTPSASTFTPSPVDSQSSPPQQGSVLQPLTQSRSLPAITPNSNRRASHSSLRRSSSIGNASTRSAGVNLKISQEQYSKFYEKQAFSLVDLVYSIAGSDFDWLVNMLGTMLRGTDFHTIAAAENAVSGLRRASAHCGAPDDDDDDDIAAEPGSNTTSVLPKSAGNRMKHSRVVCEKLVNSLIDYLIQLEEGTAVIFRQTKSATLSPAAQLVCVMQTLNVFATVWPPLLAPHVQVISPYLHEEECISKADQLIILQCVTNILNKVIPLIENTSSPYWIRVARDLQHLIFTQPPSVLLPATECIGKLAQRGDSLLTIAESILDKFFTFLQKFKALDTLEEQKPNVVSSVQRAVYGSGALCMSCGFISPENDQRPITDVDNIKLRGGFKCATLVQPPEHTTVNEQVLVQLAHFAQFLRSCDVLTRRKALQGLGFLFRGDSDLMQRNSSKLILRDAMRDTSPEIRCVVLDMLFDLLEAEEARVEIGLDKQEMAMNTTREDRVLGDQDLLGGVAGSIVQENINTVLNMLFDESPQVRISCVMLVGILLRQGLVNPLNCVENLVALVSDHEIAVRETAQDQLTIIHSKHPDFLQSRAFQGVMKSYDFQMRAFGTVSALPVILNDDDQSAVVSESACSFSVFSNLYKNCIGSNRKQRGVFLRNVANSFDVATAGKRSILSVPMLEYLAKAVATLPYTSSDEPLDIIFHINRTLSLRTSVVLDSLGSMCFQLKDNDVEYDWSNTEEEMEGGTEEDPVPCIGVDLVHQALALCIAARVKVYLKDVYKLSDAKCLAYNPSDTTKSHDRSLAHVVQVLPEFEPLSRVEFHAFNAMDGSNKTQSNRETCIIVGKVLYRLTLEASDDISTAVPAARGRKRKKAPPETAESLPTAAEKTSKINSDE